MRSSCRVVCVLHTWTPTGKHSSFSPVAVFVMLCHAMLCCHRFIVQDTVEENVARLSRERAAAMDMTAAVPVKGGTGGAAEGAQLTVREVAALVCSRWGEARDV